MVAVPGNPDPNSFYHLTGDLPHPLACHGLACFAARARNPGLYAEAEAQHPRAYCLGHCYAAPYARYRQEGASSGGLGPASAAPYARYRQDGASSGGLGPASAAPADGIQPSRPLLKVFSPRAVVLESVVAGPARSLGEYQRRGGYKALRKALQGTPGEVVAAVEGSGLRGRGGAGFPTGVKWRVVAREPSCEKYVVANADEGDPGAYIDRVLMEDDPFRLIEAITLAGFAVGASKGFIYLRGEYPEAARILREALQEGVQANWLGPTILGSKFSFEIVLHLGQGSYVCGEETALLNSLEGRRPEPRARPPHTAQSGYGGKPTLVNNVETLASVPWILLHGAEAYRTMGFSESRGTKLVSLNSLFRNPGLYEVEFGVPVREILEGFGGGCSSGRFWGVMIGGPLAGVLPPGLWDIPFGFEELRAQGCAVGHGGVVGFDSGTTAAQLLHHVFSFGAYESCGKCTPCRLGTRRLEEIFTEPSEGIRVAPSAREEFGRIVEALHEASFCAFGTGLSEFARSLLRHYPKEMEGCFK